MNELEHKQVALLATDGFEEQDLTAVQRTLADAGARTELVSERRGNIQGWTGDERGAAVAVGRSLRNAEASAYEGLVILSGLRSIDRLRMEPRALAFVHAFFEQHKPVAAIGHGVLLLVEADVVRGRELTSAPSIRTDVQNAGGRWVEGSVVVDEGVVPAPFAHDDAAFDRKLVEELWEGEHAGQTPWSRSS